MVDFNTNFSDPTTSLFGATPAPATQQQTTPELGFGLSLSDLGEVDRYRNLERYPEYYINRLGEAGYRQELKAAREAADASTSTNTLGLLEGGLRQLDIDSNTSQEDAAENISGFTGNIDRFFFGRSSERDDINFIQSGLRNFLSDESATRSEGLTQLRNVLSLESRKALEGQGQVSNYEGQLLASAQSTIGGRGSSEEDIARQILNIRDLTNAARVRQQNNVRFDKNNKEWQFDPETGKPVRRVVTALNPSTGQFEIFPIEDAAGEVIAVTQRNLAPEAFISTYYENAPDGTQFFYPNPGGEFMSFIKGSEIDPYAGG